MSLAIFARPGDVGIIKDRGLDAASLAVHEVLDLFALALVEQGKMLQPGNHIWWRAGRKAPTQLACGRLQDPRALLVLLPRADRDDHEQANDHAQDDKRKKENPHFKLILFFLVPSLRFAPLRETKLRTMNFAPRRRVGTKGAKVNQMPLEINRVRSLEDLQLFSRSGLFQYLNNFRAVFGRGHNQSCSAITSASINICSPRDQQAYRRDVSLKRCDH
jgi:hypothetical protein